MMTAPAPRSLYRLSALAVACFLLPGCGKPARMEVTESRATFTGEPTPQTGLSAQQRFAENDAQRMLTWTGPEGWRQVAATQFRHINYIFGPSGEGECYLTLLPVRSGGGLLDNLNRWRKQMGAEPVDEAGVEALPKKTVFGRSVPFVDLTGDYSGAAPMMGGGASPAAKSDYRMLGCIFEAPGFLFTFKMTGPAALVSEEAANFDAFCQSIGVNAMGGGQP